MSSLNLQDPYGPYGSLLQSNADKTANRAAMNMPGYSQMSDQYKEINQADFPDYMDRFSGMVGSPTDFIGGLPGMGGDGGYGPIGAEALGEFGEGAYELFDKFKPGMEYIAENQGVGEQELASRLGTASGGMQRNIADQEAQQVRQMQRMGMDPSSGAWQAGAGDRAMQGAQGLSGLQEQVRGGARADDWKQRMEAAGIGLNVAGQGTNALSQATGAYNDALGAYGGMYGDYASGLANMGNLTENARQYNYSQAGNLAQGLTGARPAFDNTGYGQYNQDQAYVSSGGSPWALGGSAPSSIGR